MKILVKYLHHADFRSGEREQGSRARAIYWRESGFTLLELMITITVAVILISIAVPSYRSTILSSRLTTATNDFVAAVNMAKLEAVRRNRAIQFCAGTAAGNGGDILGTACGTSAGAVQVVESDGITATKLYEAPKKPADISVSAVTALRFGGQGLARKVGDASPTYTGLLVDISSDKIETNNHRCIYVTTGSTISTCSYTSALGGCPASENSSTCK
ncbi:MAG: GspH/FimT family pseudopilin [Pseudomonadota bacterium]